MIRKICDTQLLMSVMASLSGDNMVLNMNQINNEYTTLPREHHLEYKWHFKKYLKDLIQKNIPDVDCETSNQRSGVCYVVRVC